MSPPTVQLVRQVVWASLASGVDDRASEAAPAAAPPAPPAAEAVPLLARLAAFVGGVRELVPTTDPFPWGPLERLLQEAVAALAASDQLFWTAHRPGAEEGADHLALHQTRAAIIAMRIGVALGYEGRRLSELGMGACLSDAGLWELPAHVALAADALSAGDQELYRSHPKLSAALLRRWGAPSDLIIDAVLQHHEREQGQGYPHGVRGPAVHPDAKIIGLADAYAALIVPPPPRAGRPPHDAIRELMRWRRHAFDPVLIKALVNETTLFPPGTLVRLSNGQLARVLQLNRTHPLRPRVEVLKKDHTVARVIDLVQHPFVYITGAAPQ